MSYIFDASCLIYFGKLGILEKVKELRGEKYITEGVYNEVVLKGLERKESEASYIDNMIKNRVMTIRKPKYLIGDIPPLTIADREAISLAKETKSILIMDEKYARKTTAQYGIEYHGSLYLILELIKRQIITKKEAVRYIDEMIKLGFYLSIEKYREVLNMIEKM